MQEWREVYDFWFGAPDTAGHGKVRELWFGGGPEADTEIRTRFEAVHARAAQGALSGWNAAPRSSVALVVLLDQFPRNIFRGRPDAFATDPLALETARELVSGPLHAELITVEKVFAYMPFEHSEDIDNQNRCVDLFEALEPHEKKQEWVDYAIEHRDIIARFGRFPHRNDILGRATTDEEASWLATTDQRFGTVTEPDAGEESRK